ncbi:MAG: hypothetical protein GY697_06220 [Desulfobacterales bacterium]|nr:hypothetical protein [Desulfobacterales bacterium]
MKIAIPAFHSKVSPRFDTAQELVLLEVINGNIIKRERQPLKAYSAAGKIKNLLKQGVDTLICGGIDRLSRQQIGFNRIEVYSWVTGEIEDAVSCFLRNGLHSGTIFGNNGKREGRWHFRQRGFLRNVLQKGANRVNAEADTLPESNQDRMGRGKRSPGQGRGKGQRIGRDSCSGPGRSGRREETRGGAGTSGRNENRWKTGKNSKW